ncbi:protein tyrosine phosphatase [Desmophyllum pertusum]|uniref:Protein tyrosine phosphatase n=1 Tax=Desmophyllum pertusum TaxID=174260 RepID=A0A9X0D477_9CNID|nr:protein tyrosine phosphatase [Desmophyllum pertusum]
MLQNGAESHVAISLNSPVGPVTHLAVQFIPGHGTVDRIVHNNFLLKWDTPKDAASSDFKFYDVSVFTANNNSQRVYSSMTNATQLIIPCADLEPDAHYIFRIRSNAWCGFGADNNVIGYYPPIATGGPTIQPSINVQTSKTSITVQPSKTSITVQASKTSITVQPSKNVHYRPTVKNVHYRPSVKKRPLPSNRQKRPLPSNRQKRPLTSKRQKRPNIHAPPPLGNKLANKKGLNAAVWAVPVAIVGLIFIIILAYFIHKSRRLERSMFAIINMRSRDYDGGATFHSEEEIPFLQRFSDDEPLVTA